MNRKLLIISIFCTISGTSIGVIVGRGMQSNESPGVDFGRELPVASRFSIEGGGQGGSQEKAENNAIDYKFYKTLTLDQVRERLHALNEDMSLEEKEGYVAHLLCRRWGELSPKSALAELKGMRKLCRMSFPISAVIGGWASRDPESAAAYYREERENNQLLREQGVSNIVAGLAASDTEKAWEFYSNLSKKERINSSSNFIRALLKNNPGEMGKYADALNDLPFGIDYIVREWREEDKEGYEKWKTSLPEDKQRGLTINDLVYDLANSPESVAQVLSGLSTEDKKDFLAKHLGTAFRKEGAVKMLDWLLEQSPKGEEKNVLKTHLGMTSKTEYPDVESWIDNLPAGEIRDAAIIEFAEKIPMPGYNMSRVMQMAQSLEDEKLRKQSVTKTLSNWSRVDVKSALQWLDSSTGFSEQEREKWRRKLEKAGKPLMK